MTCKCTGNSGNHPQACTPAHTHTRMHTCTHAHMHTRTHERTHTRSTRSRTQCVCVHSCIHTHMHSFLGLDTRLVHAHMHTYMHIHIYWLSEPFPHYNPSPLATFLFHLTFVCFVLFVFNSLLDLLSLLSPPPFYPLLPLNLIHLLCFPFFLPFVRPSFFFPLLNLLPSVYTSFFSINHLTFSRCSQLLSIFFV